MSEFIEAFTKVQAEAAETAKRLGFEDNTSNPLYVPAKLALIASEVTEALESHRKGDDAHIVVDLADIVLRTMDLASALNVDLAKAILDKAELNKKRTFRNGNLRY